ncbi:MAG TPA: intradiol ring-cleavage dioxygenase [Polyangiaceae bacterium]|nr:intradiol ring-cleavage dioxygenase [Polyangiaceae bacterium]
MKVVPATRRETLMLLGAAGASLAGCGRVQSGESRDATSGGGAGAAGEPQCVLRPAQTIGPYPNKAELERSDIRAGQEGALLRLGLRVLAVGACTPVVGATVDVWQCNASGNYSEYDAFGTADQNWLRGFQLTGEDGSVEFSTIYPGWYPGRTVHIHFRVRTATADFVSQLYFDDALSDEVLQASPYSAHTGVRARNANDGIFAVGGAELVLNVAAEGAEYRATYDVGLDLG